MHRLDSQCAAGEDTAAVLAVFRSRTSCLVHPISANYGIAANSRCAIVADARALDVIAGKTIVADRAAIHIEVRCGGLNIHARTFAVVAGQGVAADLTAVHGEASIGDVYAAAVHSACVGDCAVFRDLAVLSAVAECECGAVGEHDRINCRCCGDAVAVQTKPGVARDAEWRIKA